MLSFTDAELSRFVAGFLWPLARIAAFIGAAPVFGNVGIPKRVKVMLAIGVTIAVMPGTGAAPISAAILASGHMNSAMNRDSSASVKLIIEPGLNRS